MHVKFLRDKYIQKSLYAKIKLLTEMLADLYIYGMFDNGLI